MAPPASRPHRGLPPTPQPALARTLPRFRRGSWHGALAASALVLAWRGPHLAYEVGQAPPAPSAHQALPPLRSASNSSATRL